MQGLVENICTPEFLATFQGNEFLSDNLFCAPEFEDNTDREYFKDLKPDDSFNEIFREQLKQALIEYVKIKFPEMYKYMLLQTLDALHDGHTNSVESLCLTPRWQSGFWI